MNENLCKQCGKERDQYKLNETVLEESPQSHIELILEVCATCHPRFAQDQDQAYGLSAFMIMRMLYQRGLEKTGCENKADTLALLMADFCTDDSKFMALSGENRQKVLEFFNAKEVNA